MRLRQGWGSNISHTPPVVTDTVADVRPYLYKNVLFVMPLRLSGGTRIKVLKGMSMAKAVVSTSVGCEGIDVSHWEHVLTVNEPRAFANVHPEPTFRLVRNPSSGAP